ncbi:MAG: FKBP-type peptidyl-prolyl cis-trans isomerase [Prevotella sp.]|nr:FKBP-type peptidyl-prolyl cis-trans isomerase [Prevotella sp.]
MLVSCSEADDTVEEYADWDEKNAEWFVAKYADVQSKIAGGDTSWRVIRSFAKGDTMLVKSPADYIVVQVVDSLASPVDEHPIYTDSVAVHYRGWLIPSASYAGGYQFDSSYMGTFDAAIASPAEFAVKSLVPGFSTALMYMRRGDHWRVSIPYQLAYGSSANGSIPAYSNLIFEIRLVDFWH